MKKAVVFGVGRNYQNYESRLNELFDVVLLIDNNYQLYTQVKPVDSINSVDYDVVIITPVNYEEMQEQLLSLGVDKDKISLMICVPEIYRSEILGYQYWGQHCDDLIIAAIFARMGIDKPSYMDLGANVPIQCSNTYFLYKNGCRGINIDANPEAIKLFNIVKPEDKNINVGIADKSGEMDYFIFDRLSGRNTFSQLEVEIFGRSVEKIVKLKVVTLKEIVDKYCPDGFPDFLDCDIEGLDYEVLSGYDLAKNGPKVICVEVRQADIMKFDLMLKHKGYFRFCRIGENNIYAKNEYSNALIHRLIEN